MNKSLRNVLLASTAFGLLLASPAHAADSTAETLAALQAQVTALQKQLADLQAKEKTRDATVAKAVKAAEKAESSAMGEKKEILPGVSVKLGGYVAVEGVYRDKNMTTDVNSSYRSIPFANSLNSHTDEFRGSARSTRLSLLAEGKPDADTKLEAFFETDFGASGTTSNSVQTNSYTPRLRHGYTTVERKDWGFYFLGGQAFSLATMNKKGMKARSEAGVQTIDASGPPGFVYTRSPQIRFVKSFADEKLNVGLSFESPEVNFGGITPPATVTARNGGSSPLNPDATYSNNFAPDVIAKLSYDNSYGHFEVFGLARFFRDVVNANGHNNYAMGFGGGVGAYIPVFDKKLDIAASFLGGKGIGRYSSVQLPDFAFSETGGIRPLTQMSALVGFIAHPTPEWDAYLYLGAEKIMRDSQGNAGDDYGYGSTSINTAGCYTLGGACDAQTKMVWQVSPGFWYQAYKGDYGSMRVGGQYSLTRRDAFSGTAGAPHAFENTFMMSLRYAPF